MKQRSLDSTSFERKTKQTRKREFLDDLKLVVPCAEVVALIAPHAPTRSTKGGRPPFAVGTMLRIHFFQQWFNLSDPAIEETLHNMPMFRFFASLDMGEDHLPDESTILRFRHLLKAQKLRAQTLATVNAMLMDKGLLLKQGMVVDATLIAAPSSTKNQNGEGDPSMHQTKKGNQWHFGMKAHAGVDADSGLVHSMVTSAANAHDVTQAQVLLHGKEIDVFADSGYRGIQKREQVQAKHPQVKRHVAMMPGKRKAMNKCTSMGAILERLEQTTASIRAKVEHQFRVIRRQFGYTKVKYRGLAKNTVNLVTLFALSNFWMVRKRRLNIGAQG